MDNLTREQRRKNMQAIRSKDTNIEVKLRKELWKRGIRYRKNYAKLPGRPDIALTKHKIAIFCDSEFWHGFDWERSKNRLKSNLDYWIPKIQRNMARDERVNYILESEGWLVIRLWEGKINKELESCINLILDAIEYQKKNLPSFRKRRRHENKTH